MKSAQFDQVGLPGEVLKVVEVPIPEPGPGEVRIKVTACNINPSDVMFIQGMYGLRPQFPQVAGFEAAGVVDACGEGVTFKMGAPVIFSAMGVWQEYVVVSAKGVMPAPQGMPPEVACQAFVNPYTAYAMVEESGLQAGQWLLLTAGGSAFGKLVLQLCKEKGIHVICTVRREVQIEDLKALGAAAVVNTQEEDWPRQVRAVTGQKGVDYVFDAVGGKTGAGALDCLVRGGEMMVYGLLSLRPIPLNSGLLIFKDITLKGFWLNKWLGALNKEEKIAVTQKILTLLATEGLKVEVEAKYSIDEVAKAVAHADGPGRKGKVILTF